jgi:hypothetical protein
MLSAFLGDTSFRDTSAMWSANVIYLYTTNSTTITCNDFSDPLPPPQPSLRSSAGVLLASSSVTPPLALWLMTSNCFWVDAPRSLAMENKYLFVYGYNYDRKFYEYILWYNYVCDYMYYLAFTILS